MKKSKKKIVLAIILILTLGLIFVIGQDSFSRYATQIQGKGVIEVGGWSFLVNGNESNFTRINLGETANEKMIPGASGVFNIIVDATGSDVDIDYSVQFLNETEKPKNVIFTYDGIVVNNITELSMLLEGRIAKDDENKRRILTVDWRWPMDSDDNEQDTEDAKNIDEYSFDIIATGLQAIVDY